MKKYWCIIVVCLFPLFLYTQISNLQFEQVIDRSVQYRATFLEHNGKLYVDASGAVEEYDILENGELELISFIEKFIHAPARAIIIGDTLFVADYIMDQESRIMVIDISGEEMNLVEMITIPENPEQFLLDSFSGNNDYFFYHLDGNVNSTILNRTTLEFVTEIPTGSYFTVKDTLLFIEMDNAGQSALAIQNISDVYNPTEIAFLLTGDYEGNRSYVFYDTLLFITRSTEVLIIDISNIENPSIISSINNIPNIPDYNFFLNLIVCNNFVLFVNNENTLWVYDITNIYLPYFLNHQDFDIGVTYKPPLILYEDYIYFSTRNSNIYQFDALSLPAIDIIGEYGESGYFLSHYLCYPFVVYSADFTVKYFNLEEGEPEINLLSDFYHSDFCSNDSLLFSIKDTDSGYYLSIHQYDSEQIYLIADYNLNTTNPITLKYYDPYLYVSERYANTLQIFAINQDYSLAQVHEMNFNSQPSLCDINENLSTEYLYIRTDENNSVDITVIENQLPFNEVGNFSLDQFAGSDRWFYLLSENRALILSDYMVLNPSVYLCEYTFPDGLEILDEEIISNDGHIQLYNDFFIATHFFDGNVYYYKWQNNEIELVYNYDFGVAVWKNILLPESNKLYACGIHYISEYSCDFVSANDNQIPILDANLSNHPNPFNPTTTITFELTAKDAKNAKLSIYNIKGQKVRSFSNHQITKSSNQKIIWNGTNENNQRVSTGVYFYQLEVDGKPIASRKCLLLK